MQVAIAGQAGRMSIVDVVCVLRTVYWYEVWEESEVGSSAGESSPVAADLVEVRELAG
jgi:hypothetical protein